MSNPILIAVLALVALGLLMGLMLAIASKTFAVEVNPLITQIEAVLPGANCGACGKPGCAGYATEIVEQNAPLDLCKPGGAEVVENIAKLLGKTVSITIIKNVAFVFCQGGARAVDRFVYSGIKTCKAAVVVAGGGNKACKYACLGFGDCVTVCKYNAIEVSKLGAAVVKPSACINCGACIKECPKKIIQETALKEVKQVICASHDAGKVVRAVCSVGCIACGICVKSCPFEAITMSEHLAVIDPEKCTNCGICMTKCPTKAIA